MSRNIITVVVAAQALSSASLHAYGAAAHFAQSSAHEVTAMRALLRAATAEVDAHLTCFEDTPLGARRVVELSLAAAAAAAVLVIMGRRVGTGAFSAVAPRARF